MSNVRYFAQGFWVDKHFAQWITSILIMIEFGLGVVIIVGGVDRFSVPSYNPLIDFSNGHTWIWGLWICLSAALISTPLRWPNIIGLWLGMVWHLIWMACFTIAVLNYPHAATTPIPIYGGMALLCSALLTARVIEKAGV
jgi:hypothetical protein